MMNDDRQTQSSQWNLQYNSSLIDNVDSLRALSVGIDWHSVEFHQMSDFVFLDPY